MPCRYDLMPGEPGTPEWYQKELDKLTKMLCDFCKAYDIQRNHDFYDLHIFMPDNVAKWWEKHQKADAKRKQEEQEVTKLEKARQKALKKFTKAERKLFGL